MNISTSTADAASFSVPGDMLCEVNPGVVLFHSGGVLCSPPWWSNRCSLPWCCAWCRSPQWCLVCTSGVVCRSPGCEVHPGDVNCIAVPIQWAVYLLLCISHRKCRHIFFLYVCSQPWEVSLNLGSNLRLPSCISFRNCLELKVLK